MKSSLRRCCLSFLALSVLGLTVIGCSGKSSEPAVIEQPPGLTDYEKSQMTPAEVEEELADRAAKAAAKSGS